MTAAPQHNPKGALAPLNVSTMQKYESAERGLLGRLLNLGIAKKSLAAFDQLTSILPSDFGMYRHQLIWHAMRQLYERRANISLANVEAELNRPLKTGERRAIEDVTTAYLNDLLDLRGGDITEYANAVRLGGMERKGVQLAHDVTKVFQDDSLDLKKRTALAQELIGRLAKQVQSLDGHPTKTFNESMEEYWKTFQIKRRALSEGDATPFGIPSGYRALDEILHGFKRGKLYIVAARPGVGKSAFGINIALNAMKSDQRVVFVALEMNDQEMTERALAIESHVSVSDLETANVSPDDVERVTECYARIQGYRSANKFHYIQFEEIPTMREIEAKLDLHISLHGTDLIVFDQMSTEAILSERPNAQLIEFMSATVARLNGWAKKYNVPVVSMAQLNREGDQEPELIHLAASDSIGKTAYVVMALHRDRSEGDKRVRLTKVKILKNRGGQDNCSIMLNYISHITKFTDD